MLTNFRLEDIQQQLVLLATTWGFRVLGALIVLIVGWTISSWAAKRTRDFIGRRTAFDKTLVPVLSTAVRLSILIVTLVVVLQQFGVAATSLVALLGAAGLAIGLALQGSLSHVAAGIMLLSFRPFNAGDLIEVGGILGSVEEVGLMFTKLNTLENIFVMVPNSEILAGAIRNYTRNATRRIDLVFGIGYDDSMAAALEIVRRELETQDFVLQEPAPVVGITELGDSSVNILARFWVRREDFVTSKLLLIKRIKERFDEEGINIPYPQRDVHILERSA